MARQEDWSEDRQVDGAREDDLSDEEGPEDETGKLTSLEVGCQLLRAIALIKEKDASIYDPKKDFFSGSLMANAYMTSEFIFLVESELEVLRKQLDLVGASLTGLRYGLNGNVLLGKRRESSKWRLRR